VEVPPSCQVIDQLQGSDLDDSVTLLPFQTSRLRIE